MHSVYVCACALVAVVAPLAASEMDVVPSHPTLPDVTVVLDVKGSFSPGAMRQMQIEATQIIGSSGIKLDWRTREEAYSNTFSDLVVITFRGSCDLEVAPPIYDGPGPYAFTRTQNGAVQPFGEVDCDHVVGAVRMAMAGDDYARFDLLIGRALGRVVAHELVHMLTRSNLHAKDGVQKPALSGKQLISSSLNLSTVDIDRLRHQRDRPH